MENGVCVIKLIGSLDAADFNSINQKFTAHCSGDKVRVLVDLSEVDFLASIGIRMLTMSAKSISTRGGRMVLFNPIEDVKTVLEMASIHVSIPMYDNYESAETVLLA